MPHPKNPIRELARQRGDKSFFDGIPCKQGHVANRYTSKSTCVECANERNARVCIEGKAERAKQGRTQRHNRKEAELRGDRTYFTGRPCSNGHVADRLTKDATCIECNKIHQAKYRASRVVKNTPCKHGHDLGRNAQGQCKECCRLNALEWNRRRAKERADWQRQDRERNPGKYRAMVRKRQARRIQATPKWADDNAIRKFYENCPEGYHVDHIIPLRGKLVSGLHVETNLQYLPPSENIGKGNRFEPIIECLA